jgi:hypothetical protein
MIVEQRYSFPNHSEDKAFPRKGSCLLFQSFAEGLEPVSWGLIHT